MPLLLAATTLLQGCQPWMGEVLHVYVKPADGTTASASPAAAKQLTAELLRAFARLHPHVVVHLQEVREEHLERRLRLGKICGLGPIC